MRVAFHTHGCRLNQSETDSMVAVVRRGGHEVVVSVEDAEVFVLNSCTITHQADADARAMVRRAKRRNPQVRVVVTGCYANADPNGVAALQGVHTVLGNGDKDGLAALLRPSAERIIAVSSLVRRTSLADLPAAPPHQRTRALLKVQDGCNYRCSFCIVPSVRGPSRSLTIPEIARQLRSLVAAGAPEVVLTGIHLGTWGRDLRPRQRLSDLIAGLLPHAGSARLRLSSIDPHEVDDALIDLIAEHPEAICRHLHLPVQSGDAVVLKRMRRGHTAQDFARLARELVARVPGIAIGTDVIVGFPGEDDEAFERTRSLLAGLPVAYHHVFSYSKRRGTAAALMEDQVGREVIGRRNKELRELSLAQTAAFSRTFAGQALDAVVESTRRDGEMRAVTDNYLRLAFRGAPAAAGRRLGVRVDPDGTSAQALR